MTSSKKFTLVPLEKDMLRQVPTPTDALSFELFQDTIHALQKHWVVELKDPTGGLERLYEIVVEDGHHKRFDVQNAGTVWQCSCVGFIEKQTGHCQHVGVVRALVERYMLFRCGWSLVSTWRARKFLPQYKTSSFDYLWYDPISGAEKVLTVGPSKRVKQPQVRSVAAVSRASVGGLVQLTEPVLMSDNISSDGILCSGLRLYDYQESIFAGMVGAKKAVCSMKMGSGKTFTSLACYGWIRSNVRADAKLLVVCPKSLKLQWKAEVKRALGMDSLCVDNVGHCKRMDEYDVHVVTYQFFARHVDEFAAKPYTLVIMDEIQNVRNDESKTWLAAKKLGSVEFFFGLSGTVIENRLEDLYAIMSVIAPGHLGPKWKFGTEFQNLVAVNRKGVVFGGVKNIEKLHAKLQGKVFGYDELALPSITHTHRDVTMTSAQWSSHDRNYGEAQKLLAKSLSSGLSYSEKMLLQSYLLKARQACNAMELITKTPSARPSPKVMAIVDDIRRFVVRGEKVVLFSQWTQFLDIIARELVVAKVGMVRFTGKETEKQRAKALADFNGKGDVMVFLSSDAGGVGLDGLQSASHVVMHTELPWNPARLDQRTGRVYRIGQTKPVEVLYYYVPGTIEEKILQVLEGKRDIRTLALSLPKD